MFPEFKPKWSIDSPDWFQRLSEENSLLREQRQTNYELTSSSGTNWFHQQLTLFVKADTLIDGMQTKLIGGIIDFDE